MHKRILSYTKNYLLVNKPERDSDAESSLILIRVLIICGHEFHSSFIPTLEKDIKYPTLSGVHSYKLNIE